MTPTDAMGTAARHGDDGLPGGHVRGPAEGHRAQLPQPGAPPARSRRASDGALDDLRRLRRAGHPVRRQGPGRGGAPRGPRGPVDPLLRPRDARRDRVLHRHRRGPADRLAGRGPRGPRRRAQPAVDGEVHAARRRRAACSSSTRRSSRPSPAGTTSTSSRCPARRSRARPATTSSCPWSRSGALVGRRRFVEPESVHRALAILLGTKKPQLVAMDVRGVRRRLRGGARAGHRVGSRPTLVRPAWVAALRADPRPWLLDPARPAVRHLALRWLEDRPADDPDVVEARAAAMRLPPIAPILAAQDPAGWWVKPGHGYGPKYTGTTWSLIVLEQLGADPADPRIAAGLRLRARPRGDRVRRLRLLRRAARGPAPAARRRCIHCLNGNLVRALVAFGHLDDPRVRGRDRLAGPGGDRRPGRARLVRRPARPARGSAAGSTRGCPCAWGAVKALRAFAAIPPDRRTPAVARAIDAGIALLLGVDPATAAYPAGWDGSDRRARGSGSGSRRATSRTCSRSPRSWASWAWARTRGSTASCASCWSARTTPGGGDNESGLPRPAVGGRGRARDAQPLGHAARLSRASRRPGLTVSRRGPRARPGPGPAPASAGPRARAPARAARRRACPPWRAAGPRSR